MLYSVLMVVQVLVAIGLIALVLLQHGKGADAGAAFGSGASATVFGSRGSANFLSRSTAVLATVFFLNSMALAFLAAERPTPSSVVETVGVEQVAPAQSDVPGEPVREVPADVPR